MVLILDNYAEQITGSSSWAQRRHSDLDHRSDLDQRADLDRRECRRSHAPSAQTLQRLGFVVGMCRPNYSAQRLQSTSNRGPDEVSNEWKPL